MTDRAILYARVSSDDSGKDGRNLEGQIEDGRLYCQQHGYSVFKEIAEDIRGISGAAEDPPGLGRALKLASEYDVLVVRNHKRFSRQSVGGFFTRLGEFEQAGVKVEFILEPSPEDDDIGQVLHAIHAYEATKEKKDIRRRTMSGRKAVVKAGNVMTHGNAPFGYRIHKEDGKTTLAIESKESWIVETVFDLYANGGLSITGVAAHLGGIPTCTDLRQSASNPKRRRFGEWSVGSVSKILRNKTYCGLWTYKGAPDEAVKVPAIISIETWEKTLERMKHNRRFARRNVKHYYLMAEHLTCGKCGSAMVCCSRKSGNGTLLYYTCNAHKLYATDCDVTTFFRADDIDLLVWDWIAEKYYDPENFCMKMREWAQQEREEKRGLFDRLAVIDDLLEDRGKQLDKLLDLYLTEDFPREMLVERKMRLEETFESLTNERGDLQSSLNSQLMFPTDADLEQEIQEYAEYWHEIILDIETFAPKEMYETQREVVEDLNLRGTLSIQDGEKLIHIRCTVGEETLSASIHSSRTRSWRIPTLILSDIIILPKRKRRKPQPIFTEVLGGARFDQPSIQI